MEYDFAILYFGMTRSTKQVYNSHIENVFNQLKKHNLSYKIFLHTWSTTGDIQAVWGNIVPSKIDYNEYKLLNPDFKKIDKQETFLESINFGDYFYKDAWNITGKDCEEWQPFLIRNHLCALESQKRGLGMIEEFVLAGNKFKKVMFIRPDVNITTILPVDEILLPCDISIPNEHHNEGFNDRFAVINYDKAAIYGKRIDELAEFRKTNGRIVSEKYLKFIIIKYNLQVNLMNFSFKIVRPAIPKE